MKKSTILALAVCGVLISGCGKGAEIEIVNENQEQTQYSEENTAQTQTSAEENTAQTQTSAEEKRKKRMAEKYSHSVKTLEIGKSKIEYPEIEIMKYSDYLDKTNETIKADIDAAAEYFSITEESGNVLTAEVDSYYVSDDEKLMSIIFYGNLIPEGGESKEIRFTVNINLENGKNYPLKERADTAKITDILADTDDFKIMNTDEKIRPMHKSNIKSYTKERLAEIIENADFTQDENGKVIYPEAFSSLESSSAYLEIGVEVPDSIGSHAEYLVDKSVLKAGI